MLTKLPKTQNSWLGFHCRLRHNTYISHFCKLCLLFTPIILEGNNITDLVFLLDGSSDVTEDEFKRSLRFVELLAKSFGVSSGDTHVALVIYADNPHTIFDLNGTLSVSDINLAVSVVSFPNTINRNVGKGLIHVSNNVIATNVRVGVPKVVVNVQNLKSLDGIDVISLQMRSRGIKVMSIGHGDEIANGQLKEMAFKPSAIFVKDIGVDTIDSINFVVSVKESIFSGKQ